MMMLLAIFLLQGLHQKPDKKSYSSWKKILEISIFLDLFSERRFRLLLKLHHSVDNEKGQHRGTRFNCENCRVALCAAPFPM
jgi:hypothetical protein